MTAPALWDTTTDAALKPASTRAEISERIRELTQAYNEAPSDLDAYIFQIRSPSDAAGYLQGVIGSSEQEEMWVLILDTKNFVRRAHMLYRGSVNSSQVRVGEVFREAVRDNAPAIIIAHNHPSGDPTPSPEDARVTREIVAAGKLLDIEVLDHLVIAEKAHVSMRMQKLGFGFDQ